MTFLPYRRAALLVAALALTGCDVVAFATDPKPILEQTWNLPVTTTSISVADLVPNNVSIYSTPGSNPPDSSAFMLNINNLQFSRQLGSDCAACQTANGTTTTKPAFILTSGSSSLLPTNVLTATMLGGTVNYSIKNSLSFDPIRVRALTDPQGYLLVLIRSGSIVVGKDSVNGADVAFPAGSTLTRAVPLSTGLVNGSIAVDLTVNSPQGDHNEFINSNGTLQTNASVANFLVGSVSINVPGKSIATDPADIDFGDFSSNVQKATIEMSVQNPWTVGGALNMDFTTPSQTVSKSLAIPTGGSPATTQVRTVTLDQADMQKLQGEKATVVLTGTMTSAAPLTVTPRQEISIDNRIILTVRTGGGK